MKIKSMIVKEPLGLHAILFGYMDAMGFLFFSCAQFAAGLFSVFAWYMFIHMVKYHIAQNLKKTDTKTNKQLSALVFKWLMEKDQVESIPLPKNHELSQTVFRFYQNYLGKR